MDKKFVIVDKTANTGQIYIDHMGENTELLENAERFDSYEDALKVLDHSHENWENWATIKDYDDF